LKSPSDWFQSLSSEMLKVRPIILHMRLRDYIRDGGAIGLLSSKYWQSLVNKVQDKYPGEEIWVFSDDFDLAKHILQPINNDIFIYIEASEKQDPAEVLLLISLGRVLLLSNSTFSLWSAKLSNTVGEIFVPYPVFQSHNSRGINLPAHWIKTSSIFATSEEIDILKHQIHQNLKTSQSQTKSLN
jgi:hypothetical protein